MTDNSKKEQQLININEVIDKDKFYIIQEGKVIELDSYVIAGKVRPDGENKQDKCASYTGNLQDLLELNSMINIMISEYHKEQLFNPNKH